MIRVEFEKQIVRLRTYLALGLMIAIPCLRWPSSLEAVRAAVETTASSP